LPTFHTKNQVVFHQLVLKIGTLGDLRDSKENPNFLEMFRREQR
jgi:hypothetical protein